MNPTFHHLSAISHHQLTESTMTINKNIIATKMGRNGAVVGPLPFKKNSIRGVKKGEYQVPPNPVFSIPNDSSS